MRLSERPSFTTICEFRFVKHNICANSAFENELQVAKHVIRINYNSKHIK